MKIVIQTESFDVGAEHKVLADRGNPGAVTLFVGHVRDIATDGQESYLFLEHYPGMAETQIEKIITEAERRWHVIDYTVIHRIGKLAAHEPIVLVGISSKHRGDAFKACEFVMDHLKSTVPFWKKEGTADSSEWLRPRNEDIDILQKW